MGIVIRPLADLRERQECVRLQEATWGQGFADQVPPSILMIAQETGGVASGAFDGDRLVGFVFGISGLRDGRKVHWSDMLAVLPGYRDHGLGFRLKLHQRDVLLALGVEQVLWTFDPLVSRNAYLNLRRLGAISHTYKRDLYGRSGSPVHEGIGTDRLLAEWWIAGDRVRDRLEDRAGVEGGAAETGEVDDAGSAEGAGPLVINPPAPGEGHARPGERLEPPEGPAVAIVVPADIESIRRADARLGLAWRGNLRDAFEAAFDAGYTATDLVRDERLSRYVLTRGLVR
jgi:predicted GNAT superfamily acetyltransferase